MGGREIKIKKSYENGAKNCPIKTRNVARLFHPLARKTRQTPRDYEELQISNEKLCLQLLWWNCLDILRLFHLLDHEAKES